MKNQITIEEIMEVCELNSKAIIVLDYIKFFLQSDKDRSTFLNEYLNRQMYTLKNKGCALLKLAKEIGSYHYPNTTLDELLNMEEWEALERLFVEPVNRAKLFRVYEHVIKASETFADGLKRLYNFRIHNTDKALMELLLYVR